MLPPPFRLFRVAPDASGPFQAKATKAPAEVLDYGFDWADMLEPDETISTSGWSWVPDSGLALFAEASEGFCTLTWVEGGLEEIYLLTNTVAFSSGRTLQAQLTLLVRG